MVVRQKNNDDKGVRKQAQTSTNTLFSSIQASVFPGHIQRPCPNTRSTCFVSLALSSGLQSRNRSGRNTSASSPKTLVSRSMAQTLTKMSVPPGTNWPQSVSPCGGTLFAKPVMAGGTIRSPSWRTAWLGQGGLDILRPHLSRGQGMIKGTVYVPVGREASWLRHW